MSSLLSGEAIDKDRKHDAASLRAMAELHRVSTSAIAACNIACSVAGVEASSTSATFHATIALCVCLLQHYIARKQEL